MPKRPLVDLFPFYQSGQYQICGPWSLGTVVMQMLAGVVFGLKTTIQGKGATDHPRMHPASFGL